MPHDPPESTAFKHAYSPDKVREMAERLAASVPEFAGERFLAEALPTLPSLEMKARVELLAASLHAALPLPFPQAAERLVGALGGPGAPSGADAWGPDRPDGTGLTGFGVWPLTRFVARYGLDHLEPSLEALAEMTRRWTAEFALRPFLDAQPERTLAALAVWTRSPDQHLRRAASESTRPRLPWGIRLRRFVADPSPVLALIEPLRADPEEYVRRSVANNLNDIGKDHPERLVETAQRWWEQGAAPTRKLVTHALRSRVKEGDPAALRVLGFAVPAAVEVTDFVLSRPQLTLGETQELRVRLRSRAPRPQRLVVDFVLHLKGARGQARQKVWKGRTFTLPAGATEDLSLSMPLRAVSTRRYYPGVHAVELMVCGERMGRREFELSIDGGQATAQRSSKPGGAGRTVSVLLACLLSGFAWLYAPAAQAAPDFASDEPSTQALAGRLWRAAVACTGWEPVTASVVPIERRELGWANGAATVRAGAGLAEIRLPTSRAGGPDALGHEIAHAWAHSHRSALSEGVAQVLAECIASRVGARAGTGPDLPPRTPDLRSWDPLSASADERSAGYELARRLARARIALFGAESVWGPSAPTHLAALRAQLQEQGPRGRQLDALLDHPEALRAFLDDEDHDDLPDGVERILGSDPSRWDSDDDGWWDGAEVAGPRRVPLPPDRSLLCLPGADGWRLVDGPLAWTRSLERWGESGWEPWLADGADLPPARLVRRGQDAAYWSGWGGRGGSWLEPVGPLRSEDEPCLEAEVLILAEGDELVRRRQGAPEATL